MVTYVPAVSESWVLKYLWPKGHKSPYKMCSCTPTQSWRTAIMQHRCARSFWETTNCSSAETLHGCARSFWETIYSLFVSRNSALLFAQCSRRLQLTQCYVIPPGRTVGSTWLAVWSGLTPSCLRRGTGGDRDPSRWGKKETIPSTTLSAQEWLLH